MTSPAVTVFIPAHNAEMWLAEAIESVLAQTFTDFELLIIDDGSRDGTRALAEAFAARDARVRVASRENRGRSATRNEAFDRARGRYLAVLDADDRCLPQRLARQVAFMDATPTVAVCGTRTLHFHKAVDLGSAAPSRSVLRKHPPGAEGVRAAQFFECAVRQSTAMFRMETIRARGYRYNTDYPVAEDYELFNRIVASDPVTNLPEVLVHYRRHEHQSTHLQGPQLHLYMAAAARESWRRYGVVTPSTSEQAKLMRPERFARLGELPVVVSAYRTLMRTAEERGGIDVALLRNHMLMHLRRLLKLRLRLREPYPIPASLPGIGSLAAQVIPAPSTSSR
jgi:glycosyltransferase involved in cell wall biosynthesis